MFCKDPMGLIFYVVFLGRERYRRKVRFRRGPDSLGDDVVLTEVDVVWLSLLVTNGHACLDVHAVCSGFVRMEVQEL